jgi:hypothetical protein
LRQNYRVGGRLHWGRPRTIADCGCRAASAQRVGASDERLFALACQRGRPRGGRGAQRPFIRAVSSGGAQRPFVRATCYVQLGKRVCAAHFGGWGCGDHSCWRGQRVVAMCALWARTRGEPPILRDVRQGARRAEIGSPTPAMWLCSAAPRGTHRAANTTSSRRGS